MNREERSEIAQMLNVSDHLFVMNFGRCVAEGPPRETALRPEVQEAYLGKRKTVSNA